MLQQDSLQTVWCSLEHLTAFLHALIFSCIVGKISTGILQTASANTLRSLEVICGLTLLKRQIKIAADGTMIFFFFFFNFIFKENKAWCFMWIIYLAEDSHEISSLIFSKKIMKKCLRMPSAVVVIGLTLKAPNKNCSRQHFNIFTFVFGKK